MTLDDSMTTREIIAMNILSRMICNPIIVAANTEDEMVETSVRFADKLRNFIYHNPHHYPAYPDAGDDDEGDYAND